MKISISKRMVAGVVALTGASAFAVAGPAAAGTNGQHVKGCTGDTQVVGMRVWGTDHNGNFAETPTRSVDGFCASFADYWFKGNITVRFYHRNGWKSEGHYYVPTSQSGDWYTAWDGEG